MSCSDDMLKLIIENVTLPIIDNCPTIITFKEINKTLPYQTFKDIYSTTCHHGQLKLFLSEIQFLTGVCNDINEKAYVIYAGSAPGNKNLYLAELFPNMKFIFVDPEEHFFKMGSKNQYTSRDLMNRVLYFQKSKFKSKFDFKRKVPFPHSINYFNTSTLKVENKHRDDVVIDSLPDNLAEVIISKSEEYSIFVIEDFFTSNLANSLHILKQKHKVFFISDIRTVTSAKGRISLDDDDSPSDGDILWNSAQMYNWLMKLQPHAYMLKFRCPFSFDSNILQFENNKDILECKDIDFIGNYKNRKYKFIKGDDIFLQAYQGKSSTETRLVGREKYSSKKYLLEIMDYDIKDFEDRLFYYNRIIRSYGWHYDIPKVFLNKYHMVDRCGDCAIMARILVDYMKKKDPKLSPDNINKEAYQILINVLKILERYFLSSGDKDNHGSYYKKFYNVDSLIYNYGQTCAKFSRYNKKLSIVSQQYSNSDFIYWAKKILGGSDKKNVRDECMLEVLFGIENKFKPIFSNIKYTQNKNNFGIIIGNESKTYKTNGLLFPTFKDLVFSRTFSDRPSIKIIDPYFYGQFKKTLNYFNIEKIYIILSSSCDFPFEKSFYNEHYKNIEIFTLINDGLNKLPKNINRNEIVCVFIDESLIVYSFIKNYLIKKYDSDKIIFLKPSPIRIYEKNYIFTSQSYIEVDVYDGDNHLKEKMISTDSIDIDKSLKYWIKDVPYVFHCKTSEELLYTSIDRYSICSRIYILQQKDINFLSIEILKDEDDIQKLFYIESLKNNDDCKIVHNYFIFVNEVVLDYFIMSKQLKKNGRNMFTFRPKSLESMDKLNVNTTSVELYNYILSEKVSQGEVKSSFKNLREIIDRVEK